MYTCRGAHLLQRLTTGGEPDGTCGGAGELHLRTARCRRCRRISALNSRSTMLTTSKTRGWSCSGGFAWMGHKHPYTAVSVLFDSTLHPRFLGDWAVPSRLQLGKLWPAPRVALDVTTAQERLNSGAAPGASRCSARPYL